MNEDGLWLAVVLILFITVISIIILVVAGSLHQEGLQPQVESFTVLNPDVDRTCTCEYDVTNEVVRYHNGTAWKTLGAGDYTVNGNIVVVDADAMD